jgi:pimeloyl-ACP methyl ester carboxylesterase
MMKWTSAVCQTNGIDIHYLRTGGAKPPVVLLHGLTGSGACWTPLARALEAQYDVVMPDARGHGLWSRPLAGYSYDEQAGDVIALIKGLNLDAPVLLGHSMGGMTAAVAAGQMGTSIRGLILADPTFLSPERQREVYESDAIEQHRQLLRSNREDVLAQARLRHPHRTSEIVELVTDARMNTPLQAFDVLTPPNPDYQRLVSAINVPILLIIADKGVVSLETAQELHALNPRLRVEAIHDAGHGLQYDQPERFAEMVKSFLQSMTTT